MNQEYSQKPYRFCIISSHRPEAAKTYGALYPYDFHWYVGQDEAQDYSAMGAAKVFESGGLMESRNQALIDCFKENKICVQLSDDMGRLRIKTPEMPEALGECMPCAVEKIIAEMDKLGACLGGIAPTDNLFFSNGKVKTHHFVVGDFIVIKPNPLRFDENLHLKEDYDYTLQQLEKYGVVARCDFLLASFKHRTNKGGAVEYRTSELEQKTIKYLLAKWPNNLKLNPRRENEILLKWKI